MCVCVCGSFLERLRRKRSRMGIQLRCAYLSYVCSHGSRVHTYLRTCALTMMCKCIDPHTHKDTHTDIRHAATERDPGDALWRPSLPQHRCTPCCGRAHALSVRVCCIHGMLSARDVGGTRRRYMWPGKARGRRPIHWGGVAVS